LGIGPGPKLHNKTGGLPLTELPFFFSFFIVQPVVILIFWFEFFMRSKKSNHCAPDEVNIGRRAGDINSAIAANPIPHGRNTPAMSLVQP